MYHGTSAYIIHLCMLTGLTSIASRPRSRAWICASPRSRKVLNLDVRHSRSENRRYISTGAHIRSMCVARRRRPASFRIHLFLRAANI